MKNPLLSLYLLAAVALNAQVNLSSSLTACYALNGNAAEPINGLTGTLSAVTATVDRFNTPGSAMEFYGTTSSMIELPNNSLIKPNEISVSVWVRLSAPGSWEDIIFTKNSSSIYFTAYALTMQNNGAGPKFRVWRQNGSGADFVESNTLVSANTWYHVVFTIDNTNMKIYINGVLENTSPSIIQNFSYDPTRTVVLGGTNELASNSPFIGTLDNLRFYNRVINASEVSALYTQDPVCIALAPAPIASFTISQNNICAGNSIQFTDLSANTPTAWLWSVSGVPSQTSSIQNPLFNFPIAGNYTVTLSATNNGGSGTATTVISVLPLPSISIVAGNTAVCMNSSVTMTASGATSYSWNTGQSGPVLTVSPATQTTYTVVGTDANGCKNQSTQAISIFPLPTVNIVASKTLVCINGIVTMTATGAMSYTWSTGQTASVVAAYPAAQTIYTVNGLNANGCKGQTTLQVKTSDCVSISGIVSDEATISVYPNPFLNSFFVEIPNGQEVDYRVTDLRGQTIQTGKLIIGNRNSIDLSTFPNGIYFISIGLNTGTKTVKLIKE